VSDRAIHAGPARSCIAISPGDALSRPLKTSETVARDVVHDIISLGLQTGDHLPSEASMLQEYSVSRESLREGLRLLEVQGLIRIRRGPGGGPVVGQIDPAHLGRISSLYYHMAGGTYAELFDAWMFTESVLAERAGRNENRAAVRTAMEPYLLRDVASDETDDLAAFVQTHTHFHAVVASLAGNRVLQIMLQTMGQIVTHHIVVVADPRDVRDIIGRDHATIARAIAAGHAARARSLMETHIAAMSQFYASQMGDQMMQDYIEWR
jgi:GntR family transcriptional regulator, transcriptional repressor for pyruvate dehydrogenase complex